MEANERPGPALAHDEFLVYDEFLADILCGFDDSDEAATQQPVARPDPEVQQPPAIAYVPPVPATALDPGTQSAAAVTSLRPSLTVRAAWRALAHRRGARRAAVAALASAAGLAAAVTTANDDQPRSQAGPTGVPPSRPSLAGADAKPSPTAAADRPSRAASTRQRPSASPRKNRRADGRPSARPASRRATPRPPVERRGPTRQQPSSPPTFTPRDRLDDRPLDAPPARLPAARASGEFTAPASTPPPPVGGEFVREFTP